MKKSNENSRDTILKCALELFSSRGYDAVGISEITESAGITKPTLYYFFGSKEGLFDALLEEEYTKFNEVVAEVCHYEPQPENYEQDVYAVLVNIARTYFRFAEQNREFYLMTMSLAFAPPTSVAAAKSMPYHMIQYALVKEIFAEFAKAHQNLVGQEDSASRRFLAFINVQIACWHQERGLLNDDEARSLVKQFMHGIYAM